MDKENKKETPEQPTLGSVAVIKIVRPLLGQAQHAKIDTGADVCSLGVDKFAVSGSYVHFVSSHLSPNVINVPIKGYMNVASADGGIEHRPVVELDVIVYYGKEQKPMHLHNVQFNLNNRTGMQYGILLGKNLLEMGKFMIDPSLKEDENKPEEKVVVTSEPVQMKLDPPDEVDHVEDKTDDTVDEKPADKKNDKFKILDELTTIELLELIEAATNQIKRQFNYFNG